MACIDDWLTNVTRKATHQRVRCKRGVEGVVETYPFNP